MPAYSIIGLSYFSLYVADLAAAIDFYTAVFGEPAYLEDGEVFGWRMGATWLTLFPARDGPDPLTTARNSEFAIQVSAAEEVDALYDKLISVGARTCRAPTDTTMYVDMRLASVDDPFGVRISVYFPAISTQL